MRGEPFAPLHDAHTKSSRPGSNYGSKDHIRLRNGRYHGYLKFDIIGLAGPVQSATLRMYVTNASPSGGSIYSVANTLIDGTTPWTEENLTGGNAPGISGSPLSSVGAAVLNTWVEFDVTAAVTGNGTYSFGLKNSSSNSVFYSSTEGNYPAELVVET